MRETMILKKLCLRMKKLMKSNSGLPFYIPIWFSGLHLYITAENFLSMVIKFIMISGLFLYPNSGQPNLEVITITLHTRDTDLTVLSSELTKMMSPLKQITFFHGIWMV